MSEPTADNPFPDFDVPQTVKHSEDLARQFTRVVTLADSAWDALMICIADGVTTVRAESRYKDWATVVLRYHDAMERVSGKDEGPHGLGSMKAQE